jgi:NAD(P)-dependent dehydrogenase (short-subunit alcohol dehydrogenase family)
VTFEVPRVLQPPRAALPLEGQVALVTGAASGLGRCIAEVLAEAGARVGMADVAFTRLQQCADELVERGLLVQALALDVTDAAQVESVVGALREQHGRFDAAVNCAAIDHTAPIDELTPQRWHAIVATNLSGPFLVARAAAAAMGPGGGHIVNIASTASKRAWPNAAAYHATKWGLLGLSHALHAELRPRGIKVCAVVAGGMRTPFLLERFPDIDPQILQDPMNVAQAVRFVLTQPAETVIPELMVLPMKEGSWP